MTTLRIYKYPFAIVVGISAVLLYHSVHNAESQDLSPGQPLLWTDPGDVASLNFEWGVGGREHQPVPPFYFVEEDFAGTIPKVNVKDSQGATWNVKFGHEANAGVFCSRLLWACGYFAAAEYFVAGGRIEGVPHLKRAGSYIRDDGSFKNARFQLRSGGPIYLDGQGWTWTDNPFLGSHELRGLKILVLLVSNWDTKDARDSVRSDGTRQMDSNLAIFEDTSAGVRRYLYADADWGASLGMWGNVLSWSKWDCAGFRDQTPTFVKARAANRLRWGFVGKHRKDITEDITVDDVKWLLQYLGKITDSQIEDGLAASGATRRESDCYRDAIRDRIEQLRQIALGPISN